MVICRNQSYDSVRERFCLKYIFSLENREIFHELLFGNCSNLLVRRALVSSTTAFLSLHCKNYIIVNAGCHQILPMRQLCIILTNLFLPSIYSNAVSWNLVEIVIQITGYRQRILDIGYLGHFSLVIIVNAKLFPSHHPVNQYAGDIMHGVNSYTRPKTPLCILLTRILVHVILLCCQVVGLRMTTMMQNFKLHYEKV